MMALIGRAIGNKYVIVGVIAAAVLAWVAWQKHKVVEAKAELAQAIEAKGALTAKLKDAAKYNNTLKLSLEMQAEDAEIQAKAADAARAKERLAWIRLNKLQKEIANVPTSQNVPVSDHVQSVLNAIADELRSPVPGTSGPDSSDQSRDAGEGDNARRDVSPEASPAPETPVS